MKRYKRVPIPFEAWKNFKNKQLEMSNQYLKITGKKRTIPLTNIILATSQKSLWFDNDDLKKFVRGKSYG